MSTLELKELSHPSGEVIKIASGKTLDLKSQGTTTLPTGSVLQVVSNYHAPSGHIEGTNTSLVSMGTAFELSITPKFSNSLILIDVLISMAHVVSGTGLMHTITKAGTPINTPTYGSYFYITGSSVSMYGPVSLQESSVAGSTSAITYGVSFRVDGNGSNCRALHNGGSYHIKLTEVAQ